MKLIMLRELTETIERKSYTGIMSMISFFAFCLMIMDCAISGGGHWLMIGPLSLRMVLGLIAFVFAAPSMLKSLRKWVRNPMMISLVLFLIYLAVSAYLGVANANRTDVLLSDLKGFAWVAMIPVALVVMGSRERIVFLLKCVVIAAILQALMIIALNIVFSLYDNWFNVFYEPLIKLQLGFADSISGRMTRIFFKSGPYLAVGIIAMLYLQCRKKKYNWFYIVGIGLCFVAILLSFTRSLYGAAFIAIVLTVVLTLIYAKRYWKKLLSTIAIGCFVAIVVILVQQAAFGANYFRFAISRTLSIDIVESELQSEETLSDEELQQQAYIARSRESDLVIRETTLKELKEMIGKSPVFGNGLGASINYREDGLVEYFYYDILNKMGIVGLLLYYFPIGYMIFVLLKRRKSADDISLVLVGVACLSGLAVFLAATFFNPYMNASIGISFYSIAIGCFGLLAKKTSLSEITITPKSSDLAQRHTPAAREDES